MKKDKVFELKIEEDDDISGIDSISLVDEPAIEVNWMFFNKEKEHSFEGDDVFVKHLMDKGESEEDMLAQGWVINKIEYLNGPENFVYTDPNGPSMEDEKEYNVRYKYILNPNISGPAIIDTSRPFCRELIAQNKVFRVEDIENAVNDFGESPLVYRGSFNCRHVWSRIEYKKDATIVNKASVNKGKVEVGGFPSGSEPDVRVLGYDEPSTVTKKTLNNPSPSTVRNLGLSKERFAGVKMSIDFDDTLSTKRGQDMAKKLLGEGIDLYIVTRRQESQSGEVYKIADEIGIPHDKVFFTNGKLKWEKLKELGITAHIDNNPDEINAIKENASDIEAIKFISDNPSKEKFELPLFPTKEEAERLAPLLYGCEGSHEHIMDGKTYYMPCEKHPIDLGYDNILPPYVDELPKKKKKEDMESYSDYPESVKNNAQAVLKWVEENGWGECGTDVGKQRANQLAKGEPISEETIQRMYSYLSRHKVDLDSSKGYGDGCGKLMYDSWGGLSALSWAESKINSFEKNSMSIQRFQTDEEKKIVIGPAMVPDLKIFRKDKQGNPYHVYFSAETIKMIAEKYMRNKYIDNNDENHDGTAVKDVYVIESWIKEDTQDKSNKYGYGDLPIGTWFVSMKIKNDEVWKKVKQGELNGFSVSGYFEEVASFCMEEMFLKQMAQILNNIQD